MNDYLLMIITNGIIVLNVFKYSLSVPLMSPSSHQHQPQQMPYVLDFGSVNKDATSPVASAQYAQQQQQQYPPYTASVGGVVAAGPIGTSERKTSITSPPSQQDDCETKTAHHVSMIPNITSGRFIRNGAPKNSAYKQHFNNNKHQGGGHKRKSEYKNGSSPGIVY